MLYSEKHPHERKSSRTSLHEGKSILKHMMRKCKVVNYVGMETSSGNTDLIETMKLENYTCQVAQSLWRGATRTSRSSRRLSLNATRSNG